MRACVCVVRCTREARQRYACTANSYVRLIAGPRARFPKGREREEDRQVERNRKNEHRKSLEGEEGEEGWKGTAVVDKFEIEWQLKVELTRRVRRPLERIELRPLRRRAVHQVVGHGSARLLSFFRNNLTSRSRSSFPLAPVSRRSFSTTNGRARAQVAHNRVRPYTRADERHRG